MVPRLIGRSTTEAELFQLHEQNQEITNISSDATGRFLYCLTPDFRDQIHVYDTYHQRSRGGYDFYPLDEAERGVRLALHNFVDGLSLMYTRFSAWYTLAVVRIDHNRRSVTELVQLLVHSAEDDDMDRPRIPQIVFHQHSAVIIVRHDQQTPSCYPFPCTIYRVDALRRQPIRAELISLPFETYGGQYIYGNVLHLIRSEIGCIRLTDQAVVDLKTFHVTTLRMHVLKKPRLDEFHFPELTTDPCVRCGDNLVGLRLTTMNELLGMDLSSLQWRRLCTGRLPSADSPTVKLLVCQAEAGRLIIYRRTEDNSATLIEVEFSAQSGHNRRSSAYRT